MLLQMKDFNKILQIGIELSTEKSRDKLLNSILTRGMEITKCDAATLYLYENDCLTFKLMNTLSLGICRGMNGDIIDDLPPVPLKEENVCAYAAIHREIINIPDVYHNDRFDFSGPRKYDAITGYHTKSQLVVPLLNNENELLGVIQMINAMSPSGEIIAFHPQYEIIIHSLGSMAAIELTNLSYMEQLKEQLYSFVEAFSTVIDERTPYNGSHTRNVARYTKLLAEYITVLNEQGLCEDSFTEDQIQKLILAALLHDIGKMTVPLSVMNRATRLESKLDEIKLRFRILKLSYENDWLKKKISQEEYLSTIKDLEDELSFIQTANTAGFLSDEAIAHVEALSQKQYVSDSGECIPYITPQEKNYLSIRKGTLTNEDRIRMENHVVMTDKILSKVHFDNNYAQVPKWASSHHEYLDGSGYPNHLTADQIGLETRILTIADIYDALTASDRPYKKPMPMEKAISILKSMAAEGKLELRLVEYLEQALGTE